MNFHTMTGKSQEDELKEHAKFRALPLVQRLRKEAESLRQRAHQLDGCSWVGTFHPGLFDRELAADLDAAANLLDEGAKGP